MILFLTLCYCAVLAVLVRVGVIKLNSFWKASPLIWVTILLIVLFIPMQWGAPAGPVMLYQTVISVTPNVSGQVIEVSAKDNVLMKKGDVLFRIDPVPYKATVDQLEASLKLSRQRFDQAQRLARTGAGSQYDVERYEADVAGLAAQLDGARWNLEQTVVLAPADGYPIGLTLEAGQRVTNMTVAAPIAFVVTTRHLIVGINQIHLRNVEPGQPVELAMKVLPGTILHGKVLGIGYMTPGGQLKPSGNVPPAPTAQQLPLPFGVIVIPDEEALEALDLVDAAGRLPGGATGTAAVYTESAQLSHLIRKIILRLEMWLNYVVPG